MTPITFALGLSSYLLYASVCHLGSRLLGSENFDEVAFLAVRATWPRHPVAKGVNFVATCLFNPVIEEIMYRGILVSLFGTLIGSYLVSVTIGIFLCLGAHLYQGTRALPYHGLFYAFSVFLLFSPLGLVGAIGMHFAADFFPFVRSRAWVQQWRDHLRRPYR